jgi:rRNA-processing protein FCF1
MNKDVIYIEPEQDITYILANIKASKHKIIALVPPKKAGVLRSAVNFKLIAKTARQNEKTVVLITTDESLRRLAGSVTMPVAKSLQSKPQLPESDDAT